MRGDVQGTGASVSPRVRCVQEAKPAMSQEIVHDSPSDAVKPIQLNNFRIHGVAATNAKAGDKLAVLVRAEIILTEIEGVLQDAHIGEQGLGASANELLTYAVNKGIEKAGDQHSLLFPVQFLRYMRDYTYAQFDPKKPQAHVMSRHSVGHGGAAPTAYTIERALQAILTLDQLNFYGVGVNHTIVKRSADAPNASGGSEDTAAKRSTS